MEMMVTSISLLSLATGGRGSCETPLRHLKSTCDAMNWSLIMIQISNYALLNFV